MAAEDGASLLVVGDHRGLPAGREARSNLCGSRSSFLPALQAVSGEVFYRMDGDWRSHGHEVASHALPLDSSLPETKDGEGATPGTQEGEIDL